MSQTKKSFTQVMTIAFSIAMAPDTGMNEIKWFRSELKRWFNNII
jgi:hypothetical protein